MLMMAKGRRKTRSRQRGVRTLAGAHATPRYKRVKDEILAGIARGDWANGSKLPSEHALVTQFGLSRMTVHRALRELAADGVISRHKGIGSFVSPPSSKSELLSIRDIAEDIQQRGHAHRAVVVVLEEIRADIGLATAFEKSVGTRLCHSVIVNFEDGTPIQLEERFVNPAFAPEYLKQDFTQITPSRYLRDLGAATEVEHIIYAGLADKRAQELLEVTPAEPCLFLMRRTWTHAVPATKSSFTFPGSRYSLGSRYKLSDFD
jgi:GntR family histidine utilization transcriptional repressor